MYVIPEDSPDEAQRRKCIMEDSVNASDIPEFIRRRFENVSRGVRGLISEHYESLLESGDMYSVRLNKQWMFPDKHISPFPWLVFSSGDTDFGVVRISHGTLKRLMFGHRACVIETIQGVKGVNSVRDLPVHAPCHRLMVEHVIAKSKNMIDKLPLWCANQRIHSEFKTRVLDRYFGLPKDGEFSNWDGRYFGCKFAALDQSNAQVRILLQKDAGTIKQIIARLYQSLITPSAAGPQVAEAEE